MATLASRARSISLNDKSFVLPPIHEFAKSRQGLNIEIFPTQAFALKVMEQVELDSKTKTIRVMDKFNETELYHLTERQYYEYLYEDGRVSCPYEDTFSPLVIEYILDIGRRGTKTTTIAIWTATKIAQVLTHYHPQEYFEILPLDPMNVTLTSLGEKNAIKLFSKFYGIIKHSPYFRPFLREPPSASSLKIWTKYDLDQLSQTKSGKSTRTNSIEISSSANTPGVRGDNNFITISDELAHYNVSANSTRDTPLDEAIYEALTPSVSGFKNPDGTPFGKNLIISSPNREAGKFYELVKDSREYGVKSGAISIEAPTWEFNPKVSSAFLRSKWRKNPDVFEVEYGAKFSSGTSKWLPGPSVHFMFSKHMENEPPQGDMSKIYFAGIDYALANDGVSLAIAHVEPSLIRHPDEYIDEVRRSRDYYDSINLPIDEPLEIVNAIVVDYTTVRFSGMPPFENLRVLNLDDVLDWIYNVTQRWPIAMGMYDQWAGDIIAQEMEKKGIEKFHKVNFSQSINDQMFKVYGDLITTNKIVVPYTKEFHRETGSLIAAKKARDIIKVEAPPGLNDDQSDATARAVYLAYCHLTKNRVALENMGFGAQHMINPIRLANASSRMRGFKPGSIRRSSNVTTNRSLRRR